MQTNKYFTSSSIPVPISQSPKVATLPHYAKSRDRLGKISILSPRGPGLGLLAPGPPLFMLRKAKEFGKSLLQQNKKFVHHRRHFDGDKLVSRLHIAGEKLEPSF